MEKGIKNTDVVARNLGPASIRTTNQRLEVTREKRQKRGKMVKRWKTEALTVKSQKTRGGISLSSKEEENYKSDTGDEMDLNQAGNNKNLLQL